MIIFTCCTQSEKSIRAPLSQWSSSPVFLLCYFKPLTSQPAMSHCKSILQAVSLFTQSGQSDVLLKVLLTWRISVHQCLSGHSEWDCSRTEKLFLLVLAYYPDESRNWVSAFFLLNPQVRKPKWMFFHLLSIP